MAGMLGKPEGNGLYEHAYSVPKRLHHPALDHNRRVVGDFHRLTYRLERRVRQRMVRARGYEILRAGARVGSRIWTTTAR